MGESVRHTTLLRWIEGYELHLTAMGLRENCQPDGNRKVCPRSVPLFLRWCANELSAWKALR
jgi:hypothetical protein